MFLVIGILFAMFCAFAVTSIVWGPWLLSMLAEHNFLITSIKEGTAKAFMRFGEFNRFAMSYREYHFDENWNVVQGGQEDRTKKGLLTAFMDSLLPGGLHWIGLPYASRVHTYHFQWTSLRQAGIGKGEQTEKGLEAIVLQKDLDDAVVARDETPDFVLLKQDVYVLTIQDTEDKDLFPISAIALLTGKVANPYKALFITEQWLEQVMNFLRPYIKEYIGGHTFKELVTSGGENNTLGAKAESDKILAYISPQGNSIRDRILDKWGFEIDHLNLVNFKIAGKQADAFQTAAATRYLKHAEGEGIMELTDAEVYRLEKISKAMTDSPYGELIRTLETYEEMGKNGNVTTIIGDKPVSMLVNSAKSAKKGE